MDSFVQGPTEENETEGQAAKRILLQKGLELRSKFRVKVFILVSENDQPSEYFGSSDFVNEYQSVGLKFKSHDVEIFPEMSGELYPEAVNLWPRHQSSKPIDGSADNQRKDECHGIQRTNVSGAVLWQHEPRTSSTHTKIGEGESRRKRVFREPHGDQDVSECGVDNSDDDAGTNLDDSNVNYSLDVENTEVQRAHETEHHFEIGEVKRHIKLRFKRKKVKRNIGGDSGGKQKRKLGTKRAIKEQEKRNKLRQLIQEPREDRPFVCEKCGRCFANLLSLQVHESNAFCSQRTCRFCDVGPLLHKDWQNHMLENHLSRMSVYKCGTCMREFMHNHLLKKHLEKEHSVKNETFKCLVCGKEFLVKSSLAEHQLNHKKLEKTFPCQSCNKKFVSEKRLLRHQYVHKAKNHECEICKERFLNSSILMLHIRRTHTREGLMNCCICRKGYMSKYELKVHQSLAHNMFEQLLPCELCGKTFTHNRRLQLHMKVVHSTQPVQCKICGKQFKNQHRLKGHSYTHAEKKLECEICHKLFALKHHYQSHMLVHSDEKPWQCSACDYRCKLKENLKKHFVKLHQKPQINKWIKDDIAADQK
ncbi:uncharacterized protein LOC100378440 [Saccoglossus kowalevskii]|uniref:Zinc finger protein 62 homolog n=1 Tax=Saccoglossus kowalevskii TaxID=10224 RepID=A0ABM0GXQ9_SACKO|nr:PREDICTED: zinc finger protein 62 homolog [Saccoglossus kowalevskii]